MSNGLHKRKPKPNGQVETISPELLSILQSAKSKAETAHVGYNAIVQEIIQQYRLVGEDSLDLATGIISRATRNMETK